MSATITHRPHLALEQARRRRMLSERVRQLPQEEVAAFLETDDGMWLFFECTAQLDLDVRTKLMKACATLPPRVFRFLGMNFDHLGEA